MVVARAVGDLLVVGVDPVADGRELAEVERRAGHGADLAGRDELGVDGREGVGVEHQLVVEDRAAVVAAEVEVGVLREVDRRGLVRRRLVLEDDLVVVGEEVGDGGGEGAGEALLAVRAHAREHDALAALVGERLGVPDHLVEPDVAAVERVRPVVRRQLVGLAVELELGPADPIPVPADDGAEVRVGLAVGVGGVARDRVEAEDDVVEVAVGIGDEERGEDAAVVRRLHHEAVRVRDGVELDGGAVGGYAERRRGGEVGPGRPFGGGGRGAARGEEEGSEAEGQGR